MFELNLRFRNYTEFHIKVNTRHVFTENNCVDIYIVFDIIAHIENFDSEVVVEKAFVYHVTPLKNIESIIAYGLKPNTYFGTDDICEYYGETITDEGEEFVLIKLPLDYIRQFSLAPDYPGIEEPITTVVGMTKDEISDAWGDSDKTALDCFEIIGSLKSLDVISVDHPDIEIIYP